MTDKIYKNPSWLEQKYWDEGLTTAEMGDLCGVNRRTIARSLNECGIERRTNSQAVQNNYASFETGGQGYEKWRSASRETDGNVTVLVHRLLAVSQWGLDAVRGMHTHHKNGVPWDNRPANLEVLSPEGHARHHHLTEANWLDILRMRELYRNGKISYSGLGRMFGTSEGTAYRIVNQREAYATESDLPNHLRYECEDRP